ncbi:MAG: PfkB family carbohydrate kinase [Kiloniellales bacterium]|nr:PfkB family carbohydrate kinase [Kiloniellales bacterium]
MFPQAIKGKIKKVDELREIIGAPPRDQKVIMCHGTFDIVHPGHVRHLIYAKSKADLLVVSLTTDAHIKKANFRPYVPEDLRALNLAALEAVDYVVIDSEPKPLRNLEILKPDYFAKGYEYVKGRVDPRTQQEIDVLKTYGGEFIYTPGDVVYSSSHIIENMPPNLSVEKLLMLMDAESLSFGNLHNALDDMKGARVHVVGDIIVDTYTHTSLIGGNTKTPTLSVRYEAKSDFVGGAGIVAKHLKAAGADVTLTTVLGDDALKDFVQEDLKKAGVRLNAVIDPTRPTTNKNAIVAGGYRLLKVDTVDNRSISENITDRFRELISRTEGDSVVFSDFRHGIFNQETIPKLIEGIPDGVLRVADSQVASRWGNITEFSGFDLITPNEREARFALGDQDSVIRPLALRLYRAAKCKTLMLTMGERGLLTYRKEPDVSPSVPEVSEDVRAFFVLDSFADNVVDAVGSGDALLSYATLAMVATGNPVIASILGAMAAAQECEYDGNVPVTTKDVRARMQRIEAQADYGEPIGAATA